MRGPLSKYLPLQRLVQLLQVLQQPVIDMGHD